MNWGATATSVPDGGGAAAPPDRSVVRGPVNPAHPALVDHALLHEPAGGRLEGLDRGPRRRPGFLPGPADVEGHLGGRHAGGLQRHGRVPVQEATLHQLGDGGHGEGERFGHLAVGSRQARERGELGQHLLQGQVLSAEDVAPPGAAVLERQHVPSRQVVDVGHVQHGVDVGRHAAVQEVEDELARRRWDAIPGPDREGRQHQRGRQTLGDGPQHLVLGHVLGALVGPVEMPDIGEGALVGRVGARDVLEPECADRAGVHEPLDTRLPGRVEDVPGAIHVDGVERLGIPGPEAVQRRHVEDRPASAHRVLHVLAATQVADHLLHVEPLEVRGVGPRLHQRDALVLPRPQLARHRRADEPAGSCDEDPVSGVELHNRVRCNVPLAIVLPNSKIRLDPRSALASTSSSASAKSSTSSSPAIRGGRSLTTFRLSAATCVRMRCRWKSGVTTIWENKAGRIASTTLKRRRRPGVVGSPKTSPIISPIPRTSWRNSYRSTSGWSALVNAFPVRWTRSRMSSSSNAAKVASPATIASWLVLNVEEWTTALSMELYTASDTEAVLSMAPTGTNPPESAFETVMMSGVMPNCSWQKKVPERPRPACTSSRIKRALCRRHSDCASCQNSSDARLTPFP